MPAPFSPTVEGVQALFPVPRISESTVPTYTQVQRWADQAAWEVAGAIDGYSALDRTDKADLYQAVVESARALAEMKAAAQVLDVAYPERAAVAEDNLAAVYRAQYEADLARLEVRVVTEVARLSPEDSGIPGVDAPAFDFPPPRFRDRQRF